MSPARSVTAKWSWGATRNESWSDSRTVKRKRNGDKEKLTMKTIVVLYAVIISCRLFAQFKPYDPNNPNPSEVDVFEARRFADEERREAFNVGDATSLNAQRHQQNAMEAKRDAHVLEDRMRANEQRRRKQEEQQAIFQGGVFNTLPSDLELMQELQAIAYLEANAPKIERFVKWKPWDTYSNRASARQTAKKNYTKAYETWAKKLGELHYGGYTTKKDRDKKIKEAKKAFDEYAELYEAGMFLTAEPKPEDYSDKSRYVAHYLAFTIYIPHGYFQMTSTQRQDYYFANRTAIQARKELAGSCWNLAHTKKRIAEQQRWGGIQGNKAGKSADTRKQR